MPSSILVFTNKLIPSEDIELACLVYDIDTPWESFCEDLSLTEAEVQILDDPRLYDVIESGLVKGAALNVPFIKSVFPVSSKSYMLKDPGKHLDRICSSRDEETREWLEGALDSGEPIYMLVGVHTVLPGKKEGGTSDSVNTVLGAAFLGMPFLPAGTSYTMGGPMLFSGKAKRKNGLPGEEDKLLGLEYRQVKLRRAIVELGNDTGGKGTQNGSGSGGKGESLIKGEIQGWVGRDALVENFFSVVDDGKGSFIVSL